MDKQISLSNNARKEAGKHFGNEAYLNISPAMIKSDFALTKKQ
jgi:hypothetical protein